MAEFENDHYEQQFRKTLSIIEKDENNGWPPDKLAKNIVKIAGKKNPASAIS
ncbi:MAG: hypothetical protein HXX13_13725 [Bacteroidetes bacterium]|nr:hypothetical protein [Bacteroidota bacterium]